jgi:hypothetical protein
MVDGQLPSKLKKVKRYFDTTQSKTNIPPSEVRGL